MSAGLIELDARSKDRGGAHDHAAADGLAGDRGALVELDDERGTLGVVLPMQAPCESVQWRP